MDKTLFEAVCKVVSEVDKTFKVKEAYLFGSQAKGLAREDSDVDILIVTENIKNDDDYSIAKEIVRRHETSCGKKFHSMIVGVEFMDKWASSEDIEEIRFLEAVRQGIKIDVAQKETPTEKIDCEKEEKCN